MLSRFSYCNRRSILNLMLNSINAVFQDSNPPFQTRWLSKDDKDPQSSTSESFIPDLRSVELNKHVLSMTKALNTGKSEDEEVAGVEFLMKGALDKREEQLKRCLDRLLVILRSKLDRLDNVNLATILHQLGIIGVDSNLQSVILAHPLLKELFQLVPKFLNRLESFQVVNIIRTMAQLGKGSLHVQFGEASSGFHVLELLLTRAIHIISTFRPQTLSQLSHCLAELDFLGAKEMLPLLAVVAKSQLEGFVPRDISVFLYSLASLNYEDHVGIIPPLVSRLISCMELVDKPQQISNTVWALSKLYCDSTITLPFLKQATRWTEDKLQEFQVFEVEQYLAGMVKLRFYPGEDFLSKLDVFVRASGDVMTPNQVAFFLVACVDLHHISDPLLDLIDHIAFKNEDEVPTLVSCILWSCTMMNKLTLERVQWAARLLEDYPLHRFSRASVIQLAQTIITFRLDNPKLDANKLFPVQLSKMSLYLWYNIQMNGGIPSVTQNYVDALQRLGYRCQVQLIENGELNICAVVSPTRKKFAIEVITPLRCFINEPDRALGRVVWRGRILKASNWKVLRIFHNENWTRRDPEQQVLYLKNQIERQISDSRIEELPIVN